MTTIYGTAGRDVIAALGGDDTIASLAGGTWSAREAATTTLGRAPRPTASSVVGATIASSAAAAGHSEGQCRRRRAQGQPWRRPPFAADPTSIAVVGGAGADSIRGCERRRSSLTLKRLAAASFGARRERLVPAADEAGVLERRAGEFEREAMRIVAGAHVVPVEDVQASSAFQRAAAGEREPSSKPGGAGWGRVESRLAQLGSPGHNPPPPPGSPSSCA
jgi:hypothetical protein